MAQGLAHMADDDPGDALYELAQNFKAKGDDKSYRETLQFLVKRYPSSRRAVAALFLARQHLEEELL